MADPTVIQRDYGCKCGVDVFGCLVHKLIIALCSADYIHPDKADVDVKGLLQAECLRAGFLLPNYQVSKEGGKSICLVCSHRLITGSIKRTR